MQASEWHESAIALFVYCSNIYTKMKILSAGRSRDPGEIVVYNGVFLFYTAES